MKPKFMKYLMRNGKQSPVFCLKVVCVCERPSTQSITHPSALTFFGIHHLVKPSEISADDFASRLSPCESLSLSWYVDNWIIWVKTWLHTWLYSISVKHSAHCYVKLLFKGNFSWCIELHYWKCGIQDPGRCDPCYVRLCEPVIETAHRSCRDDWRRCV